MRSLDKLDMALQAKVYMERTDLDLNQFIERAKRWVTTTCSAEDKADKNKKRNRSDRLTQPDSVGVHHGGFGPADLGSNPVGLPSFSKWRKRETGMNGCTKQTVDQPKQHCAYIAAAFPSPRFKTKRRRGHWESIMCMTMAKNRDACKIVQAFPN